MRDIKKLKLILESIFSKTKFKFLRITQKGDYYAFFLFFKGSIFALFIFGITSLFWQDSLGIITPIHASIDQEIKAENTLNQTSIQYSQLFLGGGSFASLDASFDDSVSEAIGGVADLANATDQGTAFLSNNTLELEETIPNTERTEIKKYTVMPGDTPGGIASSFGLSLNTLLWANDLKSSEYIQPGDELTILPVDGLIYEIKYGDTLSTIASRYQAQVEDILHANDIAFAEQISAGQSLIIPGGVMPKISTYSGAPRAVAPYLQDLSGYFIRPTAGYVSQGLHGGNAVDIAGGCWQPIYAAASGNISIAIGNGRWNGGFGNYVKIAHSNGTGTLYAHMIQVSVAPGQYVVQGQIIGYTGSTGRSSGCHLHWEVHGARHPLS